MADSEDVFILYNEQEQGIEAFVAALREADVSTYFFRSDFPLGGEIVKLESAKLTAARAVVIFLGSHGWGPTQREIARNAVQMGKIILPFTLGDPPTEALSDVDALFTDRLRIDLKEPSQESYGRFVSSVVDALRRLPDEPLHSEGLRYDGIFTTLIDGSEADRLALLNRIIDRGVTNPSALAHKLIASIKERFSASNELESGRAVRDPKRLESVRSWMLSVLIWLGELDEEGTKTILDHINHRYEPEKAVRFWTLAGAINAQRSYRQAAIELARQDPAPEVSGLAEIAFDRENEKTLRGFRSAISSAQFEVVWPILRILRVFPLPSLADDVVALLNQPSQGLVYDVLFALSAHEMSAAARSHILAQITLSDLVQLVIGESRSSTPISLTAFAGVLSVFDLGEVKAALQAAAQDDEDKQIVRKILDVLLGMHPGADSDPQIPGHAADKIDITKDDIGIRRDIQTLASVMLARDVDPPLAIGLFGEWGSGKSFYMKSLEAAVEDIASRASKHTGPFCSNVVQINFNAWHYVDANLWASLVSHMLDGLAEHLEPKLTSTEQRAALAKDLVSAKSEMELANLERKLASSQLETTTKALQTKILEREQSEVKLRDLRAGDLMAVLTANPTLKTDLQSALDAVGAPAAFESAAELNAVIQGKL